MIPQIPLTLLSFMNNKKPEVKKKSKYLKIPIQIKEKCKSININTDNIVEPCENKNREKEFSSETIFESELKSKLIIHYPVTEFKNFKFMFITEDKKKISNEVDDKNLSNDKSIYSPKLLIHPTKYHILELCLKKFIDNEEISYFLKNFDKILNNDNRDILLDNNLLLLFILNNTNVSDINNIVPKFKDYSEIDKNLKSANVKDSEFYEVDITSKFLLKVRICI